MNETFVWLCRAKNNITKTWNIPLKIRSIPAFWAFFPNVPELNENS